MKQHIKSIMMLVAMSSGIILSKVIYAIIEISGGMAAPLLLFLMLFVSFCKVNLRDIKFSMLHLWIIIFQLITAIGSYYLLLPLGQVVAQGIMICFVAPVAMAAVVVGGILGAKVATIASFTLVSNVIMAIFIPLFFIHIGSEGCSFMLIFKKVAPLMIFPPILAQIFRRALPTATSWINSKKDLSYYLWLISLAFTVGGTANYVKNNLDSLDMSMAMILAFGALITCIIQYRIGGILGVSYGDRVAGEQSLGQKNTILAIWMTQTFLSPISAIAPTAYVIWQNLRNSYRIFRHTS